MPSCTNWQFLKSYYEYSKCINPNITYDIGRKCICISTLITCYKESKKFSDKQYNEFKKSLYDIDYTKYHDALYDSNVHGIMFIKLIKIMKINF